VRQSALAASYITLMGGNATHRCILTKWFKQALWADALRVVQLLCYIILEQHLVCVAGLWVPTILQSS
jgi:hypothetical protein